MHNILTNALRHRAVRRTCAHTLAAVPASQRALRWTNSPAQGSFLAFVDALGSSQPADPTQCEGWTVHELTAHLAAGSAEIADLVELELAAAPSRATRDFEEREAPYRALGGDQLRRRFFEEALRATVAVERLVQAGDRHVPFTGVPMDARALVMHIECELVMHRWDIAGSDDTSISALSDPGLALHAVTTVARMTPNVFPPRSGDGSTVALRSPGSADIAVSGVAPTAIGMAPADHSFPVVQCHPAVRTLLLWGRTPGPELPAPVGPPGAVEAVAGMLRPAAQRSA